jgi:hypothetical protein
LPDAPAAAKGSPTTEPLTSMLVTEAVALDAQLKGVLDVTEMLRSVALNRLDEQPGQSDGGVVV